MDAAFQDMKNTMAAALAEEFGSCELRFERHAEMRYRGQRSNIKVPVSDVTTVDALRRVFEREYRKRFGQINESGVLELQVLHVSGFAAVRRPEISKLPRAGTSAVAGAKRSVFFGKSYGHLSAQVFQRSSLAPGFAGWGPAVIEEYGSSTLVWPGDRFEIGHLHEIRLTCGTEEGSCRT
jgi:N-methylhydantoinase A